MFWWSMAISAAISAVSISAAQRNAQATLDYQKKNQDQVAESAKESQIDQTKQLNLGLIQKQAQSSDEAFSLSKEKMKAVGRAKTASGEAGVAGISLDNLIGDFNRQESTYVDSLKYNLEMGEDNLDMNAKGINSQTASRINGARGGLVKRPNIYAEALGIAGNGIQRASQVE